MQGMNRFESECMILKCMILKKSYWWFLESMQNVSEVCKLTKMILCHERNYLSMKYSVLWLVNILRLSYQRLLGIEYRMWHFVSWAPVEVHIEVAWLSIFEDDGLVPRIWRNCKFWPNLKKGFCVEYCSRKILVNAGLRCEEHMLVPCQSIVARWRPGNFMILIMVKYRAAEVKVYRKYGSKVVIVKLFCWWVVAE